MIRISLTLLALAVAASANEGAVCTTAATEKAEGLKFVKISASAGDVRAIADPKAKEITIDKIGEDKDEACEFSIKREEGGLFLKAETKKGLKKSCPVGIRATGPDGMDVFAATGSGDVQVKGFSTAVEAKTGSGSISVENVGGRLDAKTGSGKIEAKGLKSDAAATTGSGDISLAFAAAPKKIDAKTASGDVKVELPKGSAADWSFKSGSGKAKSTLAKTPKAATMVTAVSGSGDLEITEAK